ncbi:MAG: DUF362 domain-containing protein [Deltaproteobacteria bacterium]|jgi:uncharacterized protein (DUF362 family)|nr:DUF362 domain-containing protein [Deltaproteobacteria bacterium]MBW2533171.1 DUF362 domain-containing protein [Deltaproteobacteria bacterium]
MPGSNVPPQTVVTVSRPELSYAADPPFERPHPVYQAVEAVLAALGLDAAGVGQDGWNPLGDLVEPGGHVVVKPNLVASRNQHERIAHQALLGSSTHGSVLKPVLDYALRAVGPEGKVTVVDCPIESCELDRVTEPLGIDSVVDHLRSQGKPVAFHDLRHFRVEPRFALDDVRRLGLSLNAGLLLRRPLPGDPRGYRVVDLGSKSFFDQAGAPPSDALRFHRSHYRTPVPHHSARRHEYSVAATALDADLIVHLPKLKTHIKAGVTLALKSVVGLSNEKYWLPHYTAGDPSTGGDEFDRPLNPVERLERRLSRLPLPGGNSLVLRAARTRGGPRVLDGGWEGNDTLWRTVLDLNRIVYYAGRDGRLHDEPQRRQLCLVDGIVGGEGDGPLGATPVRSGVLVGGLDPALVDYVATRTMGLDPSRVPTIVRALKSRLLPTSELHALQGVVDGPAPQLRFRAPRSWPSLRRRRSAPASA